MGAPEFVVDFPALWVVPAWVEAHCRIPDGFNRGEPYLLAEWQLWCTANFYRVRPDAQPAGTRRRDGRQVAAASAFEFRRAQVVGPQKSGKSPWSASILLAEGGGPVLFAGWAPEGAVYRCADWHCPCGWEYPYLPGEPMGRPWPTPLVQMTATSEDQVDNVYGALKSMIELGPLSSWMLVREDFVRLPNSGEIAVVTASANSRLGNPATFVLQDETGLYTTSNKLVKLAETQRRGVAGMGGRTLETTNAWDPAEQSVAQRTAESRAKDIFRFHRVPPKHLSFRNKRERRKILEHVYAGSWWVDLSAIEAEAAELMEKDPTQAERFFGNRVVPGHGAWLDDGLWESRVVERDLVA